MENTLYYTFSTISQSLAGAIALLGAFVLYRLQGLDHDLRNIGESLANTWVSDSEFQQLANSRDFGAFLAELRRRVSQPTRANWSTYQHSQLARIESQWNTRREILGAVRPVLIVSGTAMVASVTALALVTRIASDYRLAVLVLILGVLLFATCIWMFIRLILNVLRYG